MTRTTQFAPRLVTTRVAACLWLTTAIISASAASAAGLNDTGVTTCVDAAGSAVSCAAVTAVAGQDARYGRDAAAGTSALTKVGGGANGFDFTKIRNNGTAVSNAQAGTVVLGSASTDWGCTFDNNTGLMWEVKTTTGLRSSAHSYTWYNSDPFTNGGAVSASSGGACQNAGRCDTEKFVQDVNAVGLCGKTDWRMPTYRELQGLVRLGANPTIDASYFPNTDSYYFWSGSPGASSTNFAWYVYFGSGQWYVNLTQNYPFQVRLVRTGL